MGRCVGAEPEAVDQAGVSRRVQVGEDGSQTCEVRAVQPESVDLLCRDDAHRDRPGTADDGVEELLAVGRRHLLGIVELGQRPYTMTAERGIVEQNARDDERTGERPSSCLVGPGNEPGAQAPVETKEPLAGRQGHRSRIAADPARIATAARRDRTETHPAGSTHPAPRRTRVTAALPSGRASTWKRSQSPPSASRAMQKYRVVRTEPK